MGTGNNKTDNSVATLIGALILLVLFILIHSCMDHLENHVSESQLRADAAARAMQERRKTPVPMTPNPQIHPTTLAIPVVGMRESDINRTMHPKVFRQTTDSYVGTTHYVYYSDANAALNIPCTVSLQCTNGVVTKVNDYRDDPKPILHYKSGSKGSSGSKEKDTIYGDAEAFYYDHMDEFEDFDEAEEYYNELYE